MLNERLDQIDSSSGGQLIKFSVGGLVGYAVASFRGIGVAFSRSVGKFVEPSVPFPEMLGTARVNDGHAS